MARWDHDDLCDKSDTLLPSSVRYVSKEELKQLVHDDETKPTTAVLGTQVGGSHYTDCAIQPIEYIWANKLGFSEGNVVKYITRWRSKGGIKDLEKARHHISLLIEHAQNTGIK